MEVLSDLPGQMTLRVEGKDVARAFEQESGGHRWQRIPPTEKRGRVQTSTITIAVLGVPREAEVQLDPRDLEFSTCRGSGAGGQHRNVTDSAVQAKHKPSGLLVRVESERSQHQNKAQALELLRAKLMALEQEKQRTSRNEMRMHQLGTGMRGDKRRTIRIQAGEVVDHITGKTASTKQYLKGEVELLYP